MRELWIVRAKDVGKASSCRYRFKPNAVVPSCQRPMSLWKFYEIDNTNGFENLKIALYQSQREIHTVATGAVPGYLGLKSHPKDYQQKLTY